MNQPVRDFYNSNVAIEWERLDLPLCGVEFAGTLNLINKYFPNLVDKVSSMYQAAEAHRRVETEKRLGIVVISMRSDRGNEMPGHNEQ